MPVTLTFTGESFAEIMHQITMMFEADTPEPAPPPVMRPHDMGTMAAPEPQDDIVIQTLNEIHAEEQTRAYVEPEPEAKPKAKAKKAKPEAETPDPEAKAKKAIADL